MIFNSNKLKIIKTHIIDTSNTRTHTKICQFVKKNPKGIKATASREQPKVSELVQPDILFDKLLNTVKGAASTTPAIPGSNAKNMKSFSIDHVFFSLILLIYIFQLICSFCIIHCLCCVLCSHSQSKKSFQKLINRLFSCRLLFPSTLYLFLP